MGCIDYLPIMHRSFASFYLQIMLWVVAFFVSSASFSPSIALRPHHIQDRLKGELDQLVIDIWRIGDPEKPEVLFGELFDDDEVQNYYEALVGTLKAAKKREFSLLPPQSRSHLG